MDKETTKIDISDIESIENKEDASRTVTSELNQKEHLSTGNDAVEDGSEKPTTGTDAQNRDFQDSISNKAEKHSSSLDENLNSDVGSTDSEKISQASEASSIEMEDNLSTEPSTSDAGKEDLSKQSENISSDDQISQKTDELEEDDEQDDVDPDFAENLVQNPKSDTTAPKATASEVAPVGSIKSQAAIYKQPEVQPLVKNSIPQQPTPLHSNVPVESMPITLTFETSRQKITLGELEKIKEGYIFECSNPTTTPVTICANDTPIGSGELLDIEGKVGVRIIEFFNK